MESMSPASLALREEFFFSFSFFNCWAIEEALWEGVTHSQFVLRIWNSSLPDTWRANGQAGEEFSGTGEDESPMLFIFNINLLMDLAVLGLRCSIWGLHWIVWGFVRHGALSLAMALRLSCSTGCQVLAPNQGSSPCPLHCKVDS